ncbi:hypothetical protein QBC38DRAFT_129991 [Podospora fimiseda]|uniref:Uncharacterized protein n=1 Tax=Podospora fimiseda TaxID=252190 RepID=A0AAN6YS28_9PEZI|nr:hypothetical protein QBC38DRAFT_129991 [Podospora fimiseda]
METLLPNKPDHLPPELLQQILECLVPQPPEAGETKPVAYDQMVEGEPWYDFIQNRRSLASFALASRACNNMVTPLLYRHVAIYDEISLVLFFRTLIEHPEYGEWTRFLSYHMTLTDAAVIREIRRAMSTYLPNMNPASEPRHLMHAIKSALLGMETSLPRLQLRHGHFDEVPQALVNFTLMLCGRLDTLLLQVPICDEQLDYDALFSRMEAAKTHFQEYEPDRRLFSSIRTLLMQGDPELVRHLMHEKCDCEIPEIWGSQPRTYHKLLQCLPNLNSLEVTADDGVWNHPLDDSGFWGNEQTTPYLAGIRQVYLHASSSCPGNLYLLMKNAPDLETLYVDSRPDELYVPGPGLDFEHGDPQSFDVALKKFGKKLRELDVSFYDVTGNEGLIGPRGRLTQLASMKRLEKLCVQLGALYGAPAAAAELQMLDLLPPNLVELTLDDWWWAYAKKAKKMAKKWDDQQKIAHYKANAAYRTMAVKMLMLMAETVRTKMPKLQKVMLLCKIPWTWMLPGSEMTAESHFEGVTSAFESNGVKFLVECDEHWQPELETWDNRNGGGPGLRATTCVRPTPMDMDGGHYEHFTNPFDAVVGLNNLLNLASTTLDGAYMGPPMDPPVGGDDFFMDDYYAHDPFDFE